jgi:hypothetical protein
MSSKEHKIAEKKIIVKAYDTISQIGVVIPIIFKNNTHFQVSILGKITTNKKTTKVALDKTIIEIKQELTTVLGKKLQFGYFFNPEIGSLFIAGHLTPTFLTKVDERELASLPEGLSGIFRGMGIDKEEINSYLAALKNDKYCLIVRGESSLLTEVESLLNSF